MVVQGVERYKDIHLVVHHGVHVDGDAVPGQDLLGRHVKGPGPQVNTPGDGNIKVL